MYAVFFHAHQKLDRVAYRHLRSLIPADVFFPKIQSVLHFEGQRGPDSTNLKNNEFVQQPWHFIDPNDASDVELHGLINGHLEELTNALNKGDEYRSAYEAAWLAHALVDGLTPAHHYPYEKELEDLRGGQTRHERKGLVGWVYIRGESRRDSLSRSYRLIGPKGLLTTHTMFEGGAFTLMAPLRLSSARPTRDEIAEVRRIGLPEVFLRFAREVADQNLYKRFYEHGWTPKLTRDVRRELAPRMAKIITLAWYTALCDANLVPEPV